MEAEEDSSDCAASIDEELTVVDELDNSAMLLMDSSATPGPPQKWAAPVAPAPAPAPRQPLVRRGRKPATIHHLPNAAAAAAASEASGAAAPTADCDTAVLQMSLPHHNWFEQKLQQQQQQQQQQQKHIEVIGGALDGVQLVEAASESGDTDPGDGLDDGDEDQGFILYDSPSSDELPPQPPNPQPPPTVKLGVEKTQQPQQQQSAAGRSGDYGGSQYDRARLPLKKRRIQEDAASRSPPLSMRRKEAPVLAVPPVCREDEPSAATSSELTAAEADKARQPAQQLPTGADSSLAASPVPPQALASPESAGNSFLEHQKRKQMLLAQKKQLYQLMAQPPILPPTSATETTEAPIASAEVATPIKRKYQRRKPQQQPLPPPPQQQPPGRQGAVVNKSLSIDLTRDEEAMPNRYFQQQQQLYRSLGYQANPSGGGGQQLMEPAGVFLGRSAPGFAAAPGAAFGRANQYQQQPQQLGNTMDWRSSGGRLMPPSMMPPHQQQQQPQLPQLHGSQRPPPPPPLMQPAGGPVSWPNFATAAFSRPSTMPPPPPPPPQFAGYPGLRPQLPKQPQYQGYQQQQQQHQQQQQQQQQQQAFARYQQLQQHQSYPSPHTNSSIAGRVLHPTPIRATPSIPQQQQPPPPPQQQQKQQQQQQRYIPMPQLQQAQAQPPQAQFMAAEGAVASDSRPETPMQLYQRATYSTSSDLLCNQFS